MQTKYTVPTFYVHICTRTDTHIHTYIYKGTNRCARCTVAALVTGLCLLHRECALRLEHLRAYIYTWLLYIIYKYILYTTHTYKQTHGRKKNNSNKQINCLHATHLNGHPKDLPSSSYLLLVMKRGTKHTQALSSFKGFDAPCWIWTSSNGRAGVSANNCCLGKASLPGCIIIAGDKA